MSKHQHTWVDSARLEGNLMQEVCRGEDGCGESRTRKMTPEEAADFAKWRAEMARVDREGPIRVE